LAVVGTLDAWSHHRGTTAFSENLFHYVTPMGPDPSLHLIL
jgi:hypothetical protein